MFTRQSFEDKYINSRGVQAIWDAEDGCHLDYDSSCRWALRGWLRWARHDCIQTRAVQLIREGLLVRPEHGNTIGYSRLASALRQIPIGFQCYRAWPHGSTTAHSEPKRRSLALVQSALRRRAAPPLDGHWKPDARRCII